MLKHEPSGRGDGKLLLVQFASLLVLLAVIPLFERFAIGRAAMLAGLTVVIVAGIFVNRQFPGILLSGVVLVALAIPMAAASFYLENVTLFVGSCVLGGIYFAMTAVVIMWGVFRWYTATVHSIYAAVSVYLLLGLAWAMFYWGLDLADATAIEIPNRRVIPASVGSSELTAFSQIVYFSFVCMTTLGFGDILPTTAVAQMLVWTQAVVGQFYLAILVARLVSAIPVSQRDRMDQSSK